MSRLATQRSGPERKAYRQLYELAAEEGYSVHLGVKLSDYVEPADAAPGMRDWVTRAHIDMILLSEPELVPLFAVEVDGLQHHTDSRQIRRDAEKDRLLSESGIEVQRILASNVALGNGKEFFVTYLARLWLHGKSFVDAQRSGIVPLDEMFDPWWMFRVVSDEGGRSRMEPILPTSQYRNTFWTWHERGRIVSPFPQTWSFSVEQPELHTVKAILPLTEEYFLESTVQVGRLRIPDLPPEEIAEDMATADLHRQLIAWGNGAPMARRVADLSRVLPPEVDFGQRYGIWRTNHSNSYTNAWLISRLGLERVNKLFPDYSRRKNH